MSSSRKRPGRADAFDRYRRQLRLNPLAKPGPHELILVLDHLKADFNVAKILRSAQAFGVREVHLINIGPFDPAPAKGALKVVPVRQFETIEESFALLASWDFSLYCLYANAEERLGVGRLGRRAAFVVGHEEFGFSFDPASINGVRGLAIPTVGPVESLNVSIAASIAMYQYCVQWGAGR